MRVFLIIALLLISGNAMAENKVAPDKTGDKAAMKEQNFEAHKSKALQRISDRISKLQEKQSCVEAAATPEALKACFPKIASKEGKRQHDGKRGEWHKDNGKHGGDETKATDAPAQE